METSQRSPDFVEVAKSAIDTDLKIEQLRVELQQSEDNCRRSAKEGLILIDRNAQLVEELEALRTALEKVQTDKVLVEQRLKDALHSQRILSDIGDEQEENLLETTSQTAASLRQQLIALNNDNRRLQADCAHAVEQVQQVEHDYTALSDEYETLKRKHALVQDELCDLKKAEQRMQSENSELQSDNVTLQSQFANLKQRQVEFESMKLEIKQLLEEKTMLDADLNEMQKLYLIFQSQNANLMQLLENERELKESLKRELDARKLEEDARISMEALALQYKQATGFTVPDNVNSKSSHVPHDVQGPRIEAKGTRTSLFDELQQQWPMQATDDADAELKRLNTDLQNAREQLNTHERASAAIFSRASASLLQLRDLLEIATPHLTAETRQQADSKALCHDLRTAVVVVSQELSKMSEPASSKSTTEITTPLFEKTDLQSLQHFAHKCEQLASKCALLEAETTVEQADFVTLLGMVTQMQRHVNNAHKKCLKTLSRLKPANEGLDELVVHKGTHPLVLKTNVLPTLKSKLALEAVATVDVVDVVEECDAVVLGNAQDLLDDQVQNLLSTKLTTRRDDAVEAVAPTDRMSPESSEGVNKAIQRVSTDAFNQQQQQLEDVQADNAGLKSLVATQREQIHSLRDSLKNTNETAEHSLLNLKVKYDTDKHQARENLEKMRQELNQRKEDATTFASIRSMLTARCSDYVTQIENLQRKLKTSEQEKQTLSGLVHLAIRQKLTLIERIQELESHLDAVQLNQANDAAAASGYGGGGGRVRKPDSGGRRESNNRTAASGVNNDYSNNNGRRAVNQQEPSQPAAGAARVQKRHH